MKLESAKRKFKNEWIAFKYTNESKDQGDVLIHNKNRKSLYDKLDLKKSGGKVYITFTGRLIPRGCVVMFPLFS